MPISPLVQLAKKREGEEKNVILSESGGHYDIKQVVVVGTDVDVHDSAGIEWAITARFRADRDLVLVEHAQVRCWARRQPLVILTIHRRTCRASARRWDRIPRDGWLIKAGLSPDCGFSATTPSISMPLRLPIAPTSRLTWRALMSTDEAAPCRRRSRGERGRHRRTAPCYAAPDWHSRDASDRVCIYRRRIPDAAQPSANTNIPTIMIAEKIADTMLVRPRASRASNATPLAATH